MVEVQIVKCSQPTFWYTSKIGNTYKVNGTLVHDGTLNFRVSNKQGGQTCYILLDDCRVLIEGIEFQPVEEDKPHA